jgi:hypothetical protein
LKYTEGELRHKTNDALAVVSKCVKVYSDNLSDKNILIIYLSNNLLKTFEALFVPENYLHLTGLRPVNKRKISSARDFYDVCLTGRLSIDDFDFYANGDTDRKLGILPNIVNITTTAKMFGEFGGGGRFLYTERLTGGQHYCLGFVKSGTIYVPNTALAEDIRTVSKKPISRVIAIFSKAVSDTKYTLLCHIAKGYTVNSPSLHFALDQHIRNRRP